MPSINRNAGGDGGQLDGAAESAVKSGIQGGGKPLPSDTRANFESEFGADFSDVRVHTGSQANEAARSIDAEAYTVGSDIAFAKDSYDPGSSAGKELLAHELTHVVQQGGGVSRTIQREESGEGGSIAVTLCHRPFSFAQDDERLGDCNMFERLMDTRAARWFRDKDDRECRGMVADQLGDFARHCFLWAHDPDEEADRPETPIHQVRTFTYDDQVTGAPDSGATGDDVICTTTHYDVDVATAGQLRQRYAGVSECDPADYHMETQNCCGCAWAILEEIGASPSLRDFPEENRDMGLPGEESEGGAWKRFPARAANFYVDLGLPTP